MKTSELIRQLQEADPNDEAECCVDNEDIHFLEVIPAYYDGRLQVFTRDLALTGKSFDIVGAKITSAGTKIKIRHCSIADVLMDNPEMPVDTSTTGCQASNAEHAVMVARWRATGRRFCAGVFDHPDDMDVPIALGLMLLCPTCGNKRCPKATDNALDCTGSNEPGQPGSAYPKVTP